MYKGKDPKLTRKKADKKKSVSTLNQTRKTKSQKGPPKNNQKIRRYESDDSDNSIVSTPSSSEEESTTIKTSRKEKVAAIPCSFVVMNYHQYSVNMYWIN